MANTTADALKTDASSGKGARVFSFDKMAAISVALITFLLPVLLLPSSILTFQATKGLVLTVGVVVTLLLWLIARLKSDKIEFPVHSLFFFALALPVVYLIASFFSGNVGASLIGNGFEADTFLMVLTFVFLMILSVIVFKRKERNMYVYIGFFAALALVSLYQVVRLVLGPDFFSLGVLTADTSNMVGKWNDLGLFFGLGVILSLSALEFLKVKRSWKIFLSIILALSLFFSAVVNFAASWVLIGIVSLVFMVYSLSFGRSEKKSKSSRANTSGRSIAIFIIALLFVLAGGPLGSVISDAFGIAHVEARPSWDTTKNVAVESIKDNPLLGAGPNRFTNEWLEHKPTVINNTIFWNSDFNSGIGSIPSKAVTTGLVGLLTWLAFIFFYLYTASRMLWRSLVEDDMVDRFFSVSSFLASLYLWIFSIIYVPNLVMFAFAFLFTGIFLSVQYRKGRIRSLKISPEKNPRLGFITVFAIVLLLIGVTSWGYVLFGRYASAAYYQSGVYSFNTEGNLDAAERKIRSATRLTQNDRHYRTLSQLSLVRLNQIVNQQGVSDDVLRSQFQGELAKAIDSAQRAIEVDNANYQNWMALGSVYEAIVPLGIEGAYDSATNAYNRAMELNPKGPALRLAMARLEMSNEDNEAAREHITKALELKNNYTEAIFLLSQLEARAGNISRAIESVEAASLLAPNDPTVFFQLGILRYNDDRYQAAASALERAVLLLPTYSNAKYFLGHSYYELDRVEDAIAQFEDLEVLNPENEEIELILGNLRAGRSPFANAQPPINEAPEERDELPIEEEEAL